MHCKEEVYPVTVFKQLTSMLEDHFKEVSLFEHTLLAPDWEVYKTLSDIGKLVVITANSQDKIVGYTVNIISRHLHYPFLIANNDIIYMEPEHRGHGIDLIRYTENILKLKGVQYFVIGVKEHINFSLVLKRRGYNLLETNYFRRL